MKTEKRKTDQSKLEVSTWKILDELFLDETKL